MKEVRVFTTALLLIFITLKLAGYIDWHWLWVLFPFWIPLLMALCIACLTWLVRLFETPKQKSLREAMEAIEQLQQALVRRNH
jgi:hypothetical protein